MARATVARLDVIERLELDFRADPVVVFETVHQRRREPDLVGDSPVFDQRRLLGYLDQHATDTTYHDRTS